MPDKLTDKEIVKALEHCVQKFSCTSCPLYKSKSSCGGYFLEVINRLQAENEMLQKDKQPMIVNSIQDDFCGVPCEFMEEKINYTQADNKRLKADIGTLESKMITLNALIEMKNDTICNLMKTVDALESQLKTAKAEAYKEFAEGLKESNHGTLSYCTGWVDFDDINNLLKELVGD